MHQHLPPPAPGSPEAAEHERKEKYLASLKRGLQTARDESYPPSKVSNLEKEVSELEAELSILNFKSQKDIAESKLWHQNRFIKEQNVLTARQTKHAEEQEATRKKRAIRIKEEEEKHAKVLALIKTSFDDFDKTAAKLLTDDAAALTHLDTQHRANLA